MKSWDKTEKAESRESPKVLTHMLMISNFSFPAENSPQEIDIFLVLKTQRLMNFASKAPSIKTHTLSFLEF